ncbi:VCBS repeat-containing protein [Opitutaceae bacterium EW11]|nr:VCBS repeat-containing protein [Opitutaceae bacterium EW11]
MSLASSCAATTPTRVWILAALLLLGISGCKPPPARSQVRRAVAQPVTPTFVLERQPIGGPIVGKPWIAHVAAVDLDGDGLLDVVACDGQKNEVVWCRQTARGQFEEQVIATGIEGPVHAEAVDIDKDGDLDLLIASMGVIFPSNDKIGSVVILENDGHQRFTKHVVADHIARVTDVRAGDFNNDGRLDLAVAQFGYDQGEIRWMENQGNWNFKSTILLSLSGGVNVCVADLNGDRTPDIVALISQEWEEIFLFENDGSGNFMRKVIFGSTNEDYGSSGISLADVNRDGRPDILYTNGDGFDYADPGARPWHGLQWLENVGGGHFRFHRIADFEGAYSPVGVDFDGDGAMDVLAVSAFNDWKKSTAVSLMLFHNDGQNHFTPVPLAHQPTHLLTVAVGDFDGTGKPVILTGGFHAYPPYDRMSRLSLWRKVAGVR